ncbi:hypothetical protein BC826DRAFT_598546 [Russula brevipes]|nr:hypothetical protein BC826DRAFT_598546 [Russula brevipes]
MTGVIAWECLRSVLVGLSLNSADRTFGLCFLKYQVDGFLRAESPQIWTNHDGLDAGSYGLGKGESHAPTKRGNDMSVFPAVIGVVKDSKPPIVTGMRCVETFSVIRVSTAACTFLDFLNGGCLEEVDHVVKKFIVLCQCPLDSQMIRRFGGH